jgi:mono/diheme cytochrome c family protein
VRFNRAGDGLYVVDFGVMLHTKQGARPQPGTGVIWKITRAEERAVIYGAEMMRLEDFSRLGKCLAPLLLAVSVSLSGVGCRSVRRGEPFVGELPASSADVQRGRLLFAQNCYKCHPGGEGGLGPALNDKPFPAFLMKTQVRLGLGAMPSFSGHQILRQDLNDVMAYVLSLRNHDVPTDKTHNQAPHE